MTLTVLHAASCCWNSLQNFLCWIHFFQSAVSYSFFFNYRKTSDRSPQLVSVRQVALILSLYSRPGLYAKPGFYHIMSKSLFSAADALAYGSYCITLTLLGIAASEK